MKIKFNLNKIICTFCLLNLVIAQQIYSKRTNQFQASAKVFTAQSQGTNIAFEVCFNSDTFARPSREEYTTFVESNQYWLYRVRNNILNLFNSALTFSRASLVIPESAIFFSRISTSSSESSP